MEPSIAFVEDTIERVCLDARLSSLGTSSTGFALRKRTSLRLASHEQDVARERRTKFDFHLPTLEAMQEEPDRMVVQLAAIEGKGETGADRSQETAAPVQVLDREQRLEKGPEFLGVEMMMPDDAVLLTLVSMFAPLSAGRA